jgi:alpha-L-glutamate ligase-like protein
VIRSVRGLRRSSRERPMGSPDPSGSKPGKLRLVLLRHLPFITFMAGFGLYCLFLQFEMSDALQRLYLTRIFFQVAVAALLIAAMKNVLGVRTLGLFAPAIVALAFLATGLILGLALLAVTLGTVLLTRASLVRERVQEAHRVAILVTIVSITIASIAVLGLQYQMHQLFFAVLFPVLIIGWIGERYVERVDRVGWEDPTKELLWTVAAIVISFLVIIQDPLINIVMFNPIAWFLLVFLNWLLGTRVRFRLSERFRFGGVRKFFLADNAVQGDFGDDVLTMTVRNREFVGKYNPAGLLALLTKDAVKGLLLPLGVPMAATYLILRERSDLEKFKEWMKDHDTFALKPSSSYGGEGILLVKGKQGDLYNTNMGKMSASQIEALAFQILEGQFHGGQNDTAVVEELLIQDELVHDIVPMGLADIRVISFLGYPVMAMMRIPTVASGGKANIHLGAVAAGVRISTGVIFHSVWAGLPSPEHPDTGAALLGRQVPKWDEILEVAAEAQRLAGIGYAGVDIAIDAKRGPVVMEVNRRPGLEIQNANAAGLLRRLRTIERLPPHDLPVEERIRIVQKLDRENWGIQTGKPSTVLDSHEEPPSSSQGFEGHKTGTTV